MPIMSVHAGGVSAGLPSKGNLNPEKRKQVKGWNKQSAKRNADFLKQIDTKRLASFGVAYTLTVKVVPETPSDFKTIIDNFRKRLRRDGFLYDHWVIEWTKAARPHLHGVAFLPDDFTPQQIAASTNRIKNHWLILTAHLGTSERSQHVSTIENAVGWFEYMAKHASRGAGHYQREKQFIPAKWNTTGRMWGKSPNWPLSSVKYRISDNVFYRFRRASKRYLLAQNARDISANVAYKDDYRLKAALKRRQYLRRSRKINDPTLSRIRGINEWLPQEITSSLLLHFLTSDPHTQIARYSDEKLPLMPPGSSRKDYILRLLHPSEPLE